MLRDAIAAAVAIPFRKVSTLARRMVGAAVPDVVDSSPHTWALHGVSFEVPRGQIIGLIGPNGAGKSTLLKIISRITEPTDGRIEIHGRVGSHARGRHRLPSRADRPREHLPERRHARHEEGRYLAEPR